MAISGLTAAGADATLTVPLTRGVTMGIKCVICGLESDRADWVGKKDPHCEAHDAVHRTGSSAVEAPPASGPPPGQSTTPIDIDTQVIKEEAEKHKAPPPEGGTIKHFIHEVEHKVEEKLHHKKEPPPKKSGETF